MIRRAVGALGILGGGALLASFIVEIPAAWNPARLVVWHAGGVAVAIATHRFHAASSPRLALGATTAVVVAGSLAIAWIVLSIGRDSPFAGDTGWSPRPVKAAVPTVPAAALPVRVVSSGGAA